MLGCRLFRFLADQISLHHFTRYKGFLPITPYAQDQSATPTAPRAYDVGNERHCRHLDAEERRLILAKHRRGSGLRQIGRLLGRHHSTNGLELVRGATLGGYDPQVARQARDATRRRSGRRRKLFPKVPFYDWVRNHLIHWCWSPERIAARLRRMYPDGPSQRVSHETVCAQPRGEVQALMIGALRQAKPNAEPGAPRFPGLSWHWKRCVLSTAPKTLRRAWFLATGRET